MPLAATLRALVEGVTEGLLGHAVVLAPEAEAASEIGRLAEAVGADILATTGDAEADWRAAARMTRGEWLIFLDAGEMFEPGWPAAVEQHAIGGFDRSARAYRDGFGGYLARLGARFASARPESGVVLSKQALLSPMGGLTRPLALPLRLRRLI